VQVIGFGSKDLPLLKIDGTLTKQIVSNALQIELMVGK